MFNRRVSVSTPLAPNLRASWLVALCASASVFYATPSRACGPCTVPELWGLQNLRGEPVLVSNFGLLTPTDNGWLLTCEEAIGGLLLQAEGDQNRSLVSTEGGVFTQTGDMCEWGAGPAIASNEWSLSFSVAEVPSGEASESFALVIDRETQELEVERSSGNDDFAVVHSFDSLSGYRQLVSAGNPAAVFVTGYTFGPRVWNVAYSLDSGETWSEAAPDVDNDYATMTPRLVDPEAPHVLLFQAETTAGSGHEIWRFDADDASVEQVLKMQDGDIYGGMALSGDTLWVAGRRRTTGTHEAGSLYRADRRDLVFEQVVDDGPPFSCLDSFDGALFACDNEFTLDSRFLMGRSTDEGRTWEPYFTLEQLGSLESCGQACCNTMSWLNGAFGVAGTGGGASQNGCPTTTSTGASSGGAGNGGSAGADDGGTGGRDGGGGDLGAAGAGNQAGAGAHRDAGGCQCSATPSAPASSLGWAGLVALSWLGRRRRPVHRNKLAGAVLALSALLGLTGCSSGAAHDSDASQATGAAGAPNAEGDHDANCQASGADLAQLKLETDRGLELEFLEESPDPPAVGDNSWLVEIRDASGEPLSGLEDAIFVTPFMPQHGHGTPVTVGVSEESEGQYRLSPVNTFMPGLWQITVEIDTGSDPQTTEFEVCVQ